MARKKTTETTEQAEVIKANMSGIDTPERWRMGELGSHGMNIFAGVSAGELKRELNFPASIQTYKNMSYHSAINSALTLFENIIDKADWTIQPPSDATPAELEQCAKLQSMLDDMEQPWSEFISDAMSANLYGFSVHEKVYRRRLKVNGSKYDDGLIGWKKLPIRSQESISKFLFSEDGNDIVGVQQNLSGVSDPYNRFGGKPTLINIPASKMLLFRSGKHKGDPFGKSPLRQAYLSWRFITVLEELEATGVSKDISGIPLLKLPPQYLSPDASTEQKAIKTYFENAIRNLHMNKQSGIILPQAFDPDTKQPLFDLSLLSMDGKKGYDIDKIKTYYKNAIYTSMMADILVLGQGATGSFALATFKNSVASAAANSLAKMLCETLNHGLIRQTYELNNWDISRMGTLDFDGLEEIDTESLSKFIQRVASVGLVEADREVLNVVRVGMGADPLPIDLEPQNEIMTGNSSRSGDGLSTPFEGTRTSAGSGNDSSSLNADNAA